MEVSDVKNKVGSRTDCEVILATPNPDTGDTTTALIPLVYDELRHLAAYRLSQEKPGQTLQATALVNEVYIRLTAHQRNGVFPGRC